MPNYGDNKYWDKRYTEQANVTFDWLEDYNALKQIIKDLVKKEGRILILGCGNAEFSENMYDDGYEHIWNIDISEVVIKQMSDRNANRTNMKWEVMDVRELKYPDNFFDIAIDKSTIDAILCGENAFINVATMLKEVQRVLKPSGSYMAITYGSPDSRVHHFKRKHLAFDLTEYTITSEGDQEQKEDKNHYVYICKKLPEADMRAIEWGKVKEELELQEMQEIDNYDDEIDEEYQ